MHTHCAAVAAQRTLTVTAALPAAEPKSRPARRPRRLLQKRPQAGLLTQQQVDFLAQSMTRIVEERVQAEMAKIDDYLTLETHRIAALQMQSTTPQRKGEIALAAAGQPDDTLVGKLELEKHAAWEQHPSWETCSSTALKESAPDGAPSIQQCFAELLKMQPCFDAAHSGAELQISSTRHGGSEEREAEPGIDMQHAFGGRPDALVHPAGTKPVPTNIVAIIVLKQTGSATDMDSIGQAVGYAQYMLHNALAPWPPQQRPGSHHRPEGHQVGACQQGAKARPLHLPRLSSHTRGEGVAALAAVPVARAAGHGCATVQPAVCSRGRSGGAACEGLLGQRRH